MMFRSQSAYVPSSSLTRVWLKHISLALIWIGLGVFIGYSQSNHPLTELDSLDTAKNQSTDLISNTESKVKLVPNEQTKVKLCMQERESLEIKLRDLQSKLNFLDDAEKLNNFLRSLRVTNFELAELSHAYPLDSHTQVCLLKRSLMNSTLKIKSGDLVVSQGVLIGEISEINNDCFNLIPVESKQSSFEVVLEKSGVRGVAIGLGNRSIKLNTGRYEEATIELKYLERVTPAVVGERALLVRKRPFGKESSTSATIPTLSPLTVGEVVQAQIDENGLFQSALLTSPLNKSSISLVAIISVPAAQKNLSKITEKSSP